MEIVQDEEYFHIQRTNMPSPWQPGQTLVVGEMVNPFMGHYDDHFTDIRSPTGHSFRIKWLVDHVLNVLDGRENKRPDLVAFYSYDPKETLRRASEALKEYLMLVRELVFEDVRREHFPQLPSRQKCIWVIPPEEKSVKFWYTQLSGRLLRLRLTGKVHRTNQQYLTTDTLSLSEFRENAFKYWAGIKGKNSVEDEILFEGFVTVIGEVKPEEIGIKARQ